MKWLGRKKENRWKKEREKEEEKRTQKWRKSKRSEQTFQRFRADTGKLASSELTSFEFPNGPNTRRERERETRKTYQCWCMRVGWKETQVGEKENRQRVTLTKDRWSIEDDRSFCAYASFSGVGNYATAGSGGR